MFPLNIHILSLLKCRELLHLNQAGEKTSSVTWPTVKPVGLEDGLKDVTYV